VSAIQVRRAGPSDAQAIGAVFDAAVRAGWTYLGARIRRQSSGARSSICAGAVPRWMVAQDRYHQRGAMPAPAQGHCPGRGAPRHDASDERAPPTLRHPYAADALALYLALDRPTSRSPHDLLDFAFLAQTGRLRTRAPWRPAAIGLCGDARVDSVS
jgi:hypothetical protein